MFTARYELGLYIKQIAFRLERYNNENQGWETITDHEAYSGSDKDDDDDDDDDDKDSQVHVTVK